MIRRLAPLLLCFACAAPGSRLTPAPSPADRTAVLTAVNQLFDAMRQRDSVSMRRVLHGQAVLYAVRTDTGRLTAVSADEFVAAVARADQTLDERMFDPRVDVSDGIASVWTFYDFHRGSQLSHCGIDAIHLVRDGTQWKIVAITYTVQTTGCPAVR